METLVLFLEDILVVFDLLEFVLGSCDGRGLVADDVLQHADQFPHLLSGDSTGWVRRGECIFTPGSLPAFDGSSGFEVVLREAGGGRGLGPFRAWVRHRSGVRFRSVHNVAVLYRFYIRPQRSLSLVSV
jgi:hypothetical protein